MRQTSKTRRTIGVRGQLMGFLCFICLLLVGLFWFLSTQLLEPLYTTHIQKQLTEQAEAIVARMDEAIGKGEILSYWAFGSRLYVNNTFPSGRSARRITCPTATFTAPAPPTLPTSRPPTPRPAPCGSSAGRAAAQWCGRSTRPRPPAPSS